MMKIFEELGGSWEAFGDPSVTANPMGELRRMEAELGELGNTPGGGVSQTFRETGYVGGGKAVRFDD